MASVGFIPYLCDDSWSDLYGLDGRSLSYQGHRGVHTNRVARWFSCVCRDSYREKVNKGLIINVFNPVFSSHS